MNSAISLIGLVAVLISAYGIDRWVYLIRRNAAMTFNFTPYLWLASFANLFLASALLALAWYVINRSNRSLLVSITFLIVGLLVTFSSAIISTTPITFPPIGIMEYLLPESRFVFSSALVTTIGITGLILSRKENNPRA